MAIEFRKVKVGEKVRIEILATTICDRQDVEKGQIVMASAGDAIELICSGKAKYADDPVVPAVPVAVEEKPQKAKAK